MDLHLGPQNGPFLPIRQMAQILVTTPTIPEPRIEGPETPFPEKECRLCVVSVIFCVVSVNGYVVDRSPKRAQIPGFRGPGMVGVVTRIPPPRSRGPQRNPEKGCFSRFGQV